MPLAFAASLTRYEVIMQSFTPIRIRNPDKNGATVQQDDIVVVIADAVIVSHRSHKALLMVFGVIYGST